MKSILLAVIVATSSLLGGNIDRIDHSKLENSNIIEINGDKKQGLKVNDKYSNYDNMIDLYIGEDNGIVIFYTKDFSDIRLIDNR